LIIYCICRNEFTFLSEKKLIPITYCELNCFQSPYKEKENPSNSYIFYNNKKKIEKESKQAVEGVIFSTTRNKHPRNKTKRKGSQTSRSRNINKYKISVGLAMAKSNASNSLVLPLLLSMTSTFLFCVFALCDFFLRSIVHLAYLFYLFIYLCTWMVSSCYLFMYLSSDFIETDC
jgi:ribosomal protein S30